MEGNSGNVCTKLPNKCGQYTCQCGAPGWLTPVQAQSCQKCYDPCENGDPCGNALDHRNRCVQVMSRNAATSTSTAMATDAVFCGSFVCQCAGEGFVASSTQQSCNRTFFPFLSVYVFLL